MLKPLRKQLDQSPFTKQLRQLSKERMSISPRKSISPEKRLCRLKQQENHDKSQGKGNNQIKENLVLRCGKSNKNVKVHKSIAENIFKEMQNKNPNPQQLKQGSENQNQRDRSISNNKVQYSPSKPIRQQVTEYIKQREGVLKQKVTVSQNDARKENTPTRPALSHKLNQVSCSISTNKYSVGILQQKKLNANQQQSSDLNKRLNLNSSKAQLNQSQSSLNLSVISKQKVQQQIKVTYVEDQNCKLIDPDLQQYQSQSQHYRSRSSLGLKSQALQSTVYLQELRNSPIYKRRRQQSFSQSPSKMIANEVSKIMSRKIVIGESIMETESVGSKTNMTNMSNNNDSNSVIMKGSPSKNSVDNRYKRDRRQPSIDMTSSTRSLSRNAGIFSKDHSKSSRFGQKTIQEIINDTGKLSLGCNQSEFRLTMTPIQEVAQNAQQSWILKQIEKEKSKLQRNYQNITTSKSTSNIKKI